MRRKRNTEAQLETRGEMRMEKKQSAQERDGNEKISLKSKAA